MTERFIFETDDPEGRSITLHADTWEHIRSRHPEIKSITEVKTTVRTPDYITENTDLQSMTYTRFSSTSLRIRVNVIAAVEASSKKGKVKTAYLTRQDPKGEIIWQRRT